MHELQLTLSAEALRNRKLVLLFNIFPRLFSETFDLRHQPIKGNGVRLLMGDNRANLFISARESSDWMTIKVDFQLPEGAQRVNPGFHGRVLAFLAAFVLHARAHIDSGVKLDYEESTIPDVDTFERWGTWAYGQVRERFPKAV
jgi:hypothetical protein